MSKQFKKNKIILISVPLLVGLALSFLFWWWNPNLLSPLSKEDQEMIASMASPYFNGSLSPELKRKLPINLEECKRGDKRHAANGMGYQAAVVLMNTRSNCILKEYISFETFSESVNSVSLFL